MPIKLSLFLFCFQLNAFGSLQIGFWVFFFHFWSFGTKPIWEYWQAIIWYDALKYIMVQWNCLICNWVCSFFFFSGFLFIISISACFALKWVKVPSFNFGFILNLLPLLLVLVGLMNQLIVGMDLKWASNLLTFGLGTKFGTLICSFSPSSNIFSCELHIWFQCKYGF